MNASALRVVYYDDPMIDVTRPEVTGEAHGLLPTDYHKESK